MKKIVSALVMMAATSGMFLTACSTATDPSQAYKGESEQQIYDKGKAATQDKSFSEAVKRFEALNIQYPYGENTQHAQFYLIYAYYMKEDYPLASSAADQYIRTYPTAPNVDYAYYMKGLSDYYQNLGVFERFFHLDLATRDLTQIQKSYDDFNQLVTKYPDSAYAPAAHQYLVYLRNVLADHELHVAKYYYSRHAYIAAANRAGDVVAHFEGSPSVPDALAVMAKSYQALNMTDQYNQTMRVIQANYPGMKINFNS